MANTRVRQTSTPWALDLASKWVRTTLCEYSGPTTFTKITQLEWVSSSSLFQRNLSSPNWSLIEDCVWSFHNMKVCKHLHVWMHSYLHFGICAYRFKICFHSCLLQSSSVLSSIFLSSSPLLITTCPMRSDNPDYLTVLAFSITSPIGINKIDQESRRTSF